MLEEGRSENFKYFTACFLYPGVAHYHDHTALSRVLIDKHIKEIAESFIGSPIVIGGHYQPESANDPIISGTVTRVFCNTEGFVTRKGVKIEADNKYYCEYYLDSAEAVEASKDYRYVSCSYEIIDAIYPKKNLNGDLEKLTYIDGEYDAEVVKVKPRHIAIIDKPRYEQALIFENSLIVDRPDYESALIFENNTMTTASAIKENESRIEVADNIFLSFVSSTKDKGLELLTKIFDNAKKKEKQNESEEVEEKEEEEEKKNSKCKKNKKMKKKKENASEDVDDENMENEKDEDEEEDKKDNESSKKDNSLEVDGKAFDMEFVKNLVRENEKNNQKDNSKEEDVNLESIKAKATAAVKDNSVTFTVAKKITAEELYGTSK